MERKHISNKYTLTSNLCCWFTTNLVSIISGWICQGLSLQQLQEYFKRIWTWYALCRLLMFWELCEIFEGSEPDWFSDPYMKKQLMRMLYSQQFFKKKSKNIMLVFVMHIIKPWIQCTQYSTFISNLCIYWTFYWLDQLQQYAWGCIGLPSTLQAPLRSHSGILYSGMSGIPRGYSETMTKLQGEIQGTFYLTLIFNLS